MIKIATALLALLTAPAAAQEGSIFPFTPEAT